MSKDDDTSSLPPRIRAAFDYLRHTWIITEQVNVAIPTRDLTALERSVEAAALRTLQLYFLGEMDYAEEASDEKQRDSATTAKSTQ